MNTRRKVLCMAALVSVLAAIPVFAASASAVGNPAATGGGTTVEGGERSTFTFNAVQTPNGVTGHLLYQVRAGDVSFNMHIDCLAISGTSATLSGVVTRVRGDAPDFLFVGQGGVFTVTDNGEGGGASPDLISDVFLFPEASCEDGAIEPYLPIDGNIRVSQ